MTRSVHWLALLTLFLAATACEGSESEVGEVEKDLPVADVGPTGLPLGAPCILQHEWNPNASGAKGETYVEDRNTQCASTICIANHFQGRTNCPYGQAAPGNDEQQSSPPCELPDGRARVSVAVPPQLVDRRAEDVVTCSCRCDGPAGQGPFCTCPQGFECTHLIDDLFPTSTPYAGSYCIKAGTAYSASNPPQAVCEWQQQNCGPG